MGHREAAQVLGLSPLQSFRRIVLPQAIKMTLPPLASNFVQLIKFSSLGAVISVNEITRRGMELSATNFRPLETFTFIAVVYSSSAGRSPWRSAGGNGACRTADEQGPAHKS